MRFAELLKIKTQKFIVIAQKILITIFLVLIYFVGFGLTLIFVLLFHKRIIFAKRGKLDTFWLGADGYGPGILDSMKQS
jgi:hypothetical protein